MSLKRLQLPVDEVEIKEVKGSSIPLRQRLDDIESLCKSIQQLGLLQPIIIRSKGSNFEVVAGNRRLEACKRLRWRHIPCQIIELSDKEAFEVALSENLERKTLDVLEEAQAFKKYVTDFGWGGITELSTKINRSPSYISKRIRLLSLPPEALERILRDRKTPTILEEMLGLEPEFQLEVARSLDQTPMSAQQVRNLVKSIKETRWLEISHKPKDPPSSWKAIDEEQRLVIRCIDQTIAALRLASLRMDHVLEKMDKQWVEKEILTEYRYSVHSQVDSLIHLRRKLVSSQKADSHTVRI